MSTHSILRTAGIIGACLSLGAYSSAAPVEEINLAGTGLGGHTFLQTALDAVDDGGVINFIEAGTYVEPATVFVPGGKVFSVNNTSGGTVILEKGGEFFTTNKTGTAEITAPVRATFNDFTMSRISGTGTVFDVDQSQTHTIDITFNNMILQTTEDADGGEAIKIDDDASQQGAGGFAAVTIIANDTTFICGREPLDDKSAVRVQDNGWQNLTLTLNDCTLISDAGSAFRTDATGDNNVYTFSGCTFTAPGDRAIEIDDPHNNNTCIIEDSILTCERRPIYVDEDSNNNTWTIQRNTIDNSAGDDEISTGSRVINIDYATGLGNTVNIYNNVLITQEDSNADENERCIYISGDTPTNGNVFNIHHNTMTGPGTGGGVGIQFANGAEASASNNIFINLIDPIGGSTGASVFTGNLLSVEDTSAGGDRIIDTISGINLDSGYVPQTGSSAIAAGDPSAAINTAVGGVDHDGNTRPDPAGNPDIGAFEVGAPAAVKTWRAYD